MKHTREAAAIVAFPALMLVFAGCVQESGLHVRNMSDETLSIRIVENGLDPDSPTVAGIIAGPRGELAWDAHAPKNAGAFVFRFADGKEFGRPTPIPLLSDRVLTTEVEVVGDSIVLRNTRVRERIR